MNTAVRSLASSVVTPRSIIEQVNTQVGRWTVVLFAMIVLTALTMINMTNENRASVAALQQAKATTSALQSDYTQLLLEKASLTAPARINTIATKKLHMVQAKGRHLIIVNV